jgi:hypothetical protein
MHENEGESARALTESWLDRRAFLRNTTGGSAAIALAALLPSGCGAEYPAAAQDGTSLQSLTAKEYAIARAAAEALLVGVPVEPKVVATRIDRELALAGEPMRQDFKTVLGLVEHLTILGGHLRSFTRLEPDARLNYLAGWGRSRFTLRRGAYYALKGFVYYFAYIDPATRPITRFAGAWPERVKMAVRPIDFGTIA